MKDESLRDAKKARKARKGGTTKNAKKAKNTRLSAYVTSTSRGGGCDGIIKVPPFVDRAEALRLARSMVAVYPKIDWPPGRASALVPPRGSLVFLDTSVFDEETPQAFWDALMCSDNDVIAINSVWDELEPWMESNPDNYAVRAVSDGRLVLKRIREFPDGNKVTYRYYVNLLVARKTLLSKWWVEERSRTGRDPSDEELRAKEEETQRLFGVRCLGLAKKHFRKDPAADCSAHTFYTDESLVYIAVVSAIRSGQHVTIFSKDEDIHEQLFKLWHLILTHYLSMSFADVYLRDSLRFPSATVAVAREKGGYLLDDPSVKFIQLPDDSYDRYYPPGWGPVVVQCVGVGRKVSFSLFCFETGMGRLLDVKQKTGGRNVDWSDGLNLHIWPFPLLDASPYPHSAAIVRDKCEQMPWPELRIPELDFMHSVLDCERYKLWDKGLEDVFSRIR